MAISTFKARMSLHQRKDAMVKTGSGPGEGCHGMAGLAIFRKARLNMVRACCGKKDIAMAIDAVYSRNIKPEQAF